MFVTPVLSGAPPPKKNPGPAPESQVWLSDRVSSVRPQIRLQIQQNRKRKQINNSTITKFSLLC